MDTIDVDVQVVSPTDVFYQYDRDPKATQTIAARGERGGRGDGARLPGPVHGSRDAADAGHRSLAIEEMTRAIKELGLVGFMIDDHVNASPTTTTSSTSSGPRSRSSGRSSSSTSSTPRSSTYRIQDYFLLNSIGNLVDRTLAFAALVYGGVMDKYPGLKICLAHAGGYVPYALDRIDRGWEVWPD